MNATDGCNFYAMTNSFILHVGCPVAAASDTYTFVDNAPFTTDLYRNDSSTSIVNVTYASLSQ